MRIDPSVARGLDGLRRIEPELDRLAEAVGAPASAYSSSYDAFLRPRPDLEPAVITIRSGSRLLGAAVLAVRMGRLGPQIVKAGVPGEPYRLLTAEPTVAAPLARALLESLTTLDRGWRLHLSDLPADDPTVAELIKLSPHGRRHLTTPTPTLWVGEGSALTTVLSRNVRNARNKALNKITKDGRALDLRWICDPDPIADELPTIIDLHIRRNEQLRERALLHLDAERSTFTDVITSHAAAGRVRLLEARIDGQVAAFAACLVSGRRLWAYSNYAHPDWLEFSPGTISNAEVVRAAHADSAIDVVDWGAGVQRYKLSGGADLVPSQELYAWRNRHKAVLWRARNYQVHGAARPQPRDPWR